MKRVAITFTLQADLDGVPGWGDKPSDWVDLVNQRICTSDTYKPEIVVHEIMEKRYGYEDGKGYIRPDFVTAADREAVVRGHMDHIISALSLLQDIDDENDRPDDARQTRELIDKLQAAFDLPKQGASDA